MGLRMRIFLPLLISSLLLGSYIYGVWIPRLVSGAEEAYINSLHRHLDSVAEELVPLLLGRQLDTVYGNLDALLMKNDDWVSLQLFDQEGRMLYPFDNTSTRKTIKTEDVRVLKQDIRYLNAHFGDLVVKADFGPRLSEIKRRYSALLYMFLSALLMCLLTTGIVLDRLVRRPVGILVAASKQLAKGDFETPLPKVSSNEIGTLVNSFAEMRKVIGIHSKKLTSANEQLLVEVAERKRAEREIRKLNEELDLKVQERTAQLKEAQDELVRNERLSILGQLAGSMCNELRNPLGVMNNAVYYLKIAKPDADQMTKDCLDTVKNEIDNSARIISDLLDYCSTRAPQMESVSINKLISTCLDKCDIPENISLQAHIPETLPRVEADPAQMSRVFQRLITNAIQAMQEGGLLRITARLMSDAGAIGVVPREKGSDGKELQGASLPVQDFVEINISDTGCGIPDENMEKIFLPLFSTKSRGIGLGLPISQKIVESNRGKIAVKSRPGKGTDFTVILPVESNKA